MDNSNIKKQFLCVGLICVDIINHVEAYPAEDSDNRFEIE